MPGTDFKLEIVGYDRRFDDDFARLNYEWLNTYFEVEAHDKEMLDDPYNYIIKPGGWILFAIADKQVVGTVSLIVEGDKTFELAKMAVSPTYQGLKIGKKLMLAAIEYARSVGKDHLVLESNTKLLPAINLYKSTGFKEIDPNPDTPYTRCNIRMEMEI